MIKCPHCGEAFELGGKRIALSPRRRQILEWMRETPDRQFVVAEVCHKFGMGRVAAWEHVRGMINAGVVVDHKSGSGHCMSSFSLTEAGLRA